MRLWGLEVPVVRRWLAMVNEPVNSLFLKSCFGGMKRSFNCFGSDPPFLECTNSMEACN